MTGEHVAYLIITPEPFRKRGVDSLEYLLSLARDCDPWIDNVTRFFVCTPGVPLNMMFGLDFTAAARQLADQGGTAVNFTWWQENQLHNGELLQKCNLSYAPPHPIDTIDITVYPGDFFRLTNKNGTNAMRLILERHLGLSSDSAEGYNPHEHLAANPSHDETVHRYNALIVIDSEGTSRPYPIAHQPS